jgi:hypothetical protein
VLIAFTYLVAAASFGCSQTWTSTVRPDCIEPIRVRGDAAVATEPLSRDRGAALAALLGVTAAATPTTATHPDSSAATLRLAIRVIDVPP